MEGQLWPADGYRLLSPDRRRRGSRRRTILRRRLLALAVLLAAVVAFAVALEGGHPAKPSLRESPPAPAANPESAAERAALARALRRGIERAEGLGGEIEGAAMLSGWRAPVLAVSKGDQSRRWMRMWSMSKIVTAVAMLRAKGWGEGPGERLSPEVEESLRAAITRSENCPQRRIVIELQHSLGDSVEGARHAIAEVLRIAGGKARPGDEVESPEAACVEFLSAQKDVPEPLAPALLLGTSEWRVGDAARFMQALGGNAYGAAISKYLLALMREPKQHSREAVAGEFTAPVDWGAGRALSRFAPASQAGWGGTQQAAFMAGQMALLTVPSGRAAIAVMFHPAVQPGIDDPGLTAAPEALESVMRSLARELGDPQQPTWPL
jgi:hypothetical protein